MQSPLLHSAPANALVHALNREDQAAFFAAAEEVPLKFGETIYAAGAPLTHAYFPTQGFLSLLTSATATPALEIGLVGSEGMYGATLGLGVQQAPVQALVQGQGMAYRVAASDYATLCANRPRFSTLMNGYLYVSIVQLAQTAACNRSHAVGARLARWLLMTQDRAGDHTFRITHAFLATMLGVRRAGVTEAAGELQRKRLIANTRGVLTILDRPKLVAAACGCYAALRNEYTETLGEHLPNGRDEGLAGDA